MTSSDEWVLSDDSEEQQRRTVLGLESGGERAHLLTIDQQNAENRPRDDRKKKKKKKSRKEREQEFLKRFEEDLENERKSFLEKWKQENSKGLKHSKLRDRSRSKGQVDEGEGNSSEISTFLSNAELFICNMPLTIGAVGLSWVTQGVVWFKFVEENIDDCYPVRFNSNECSYPEFPGCFECDTSNPVYHAAVIFHYICNGVAGFCCVLFALKVLLAWQVVADELSNPATSTPCGVVCITVVCVAAGRGLVGKILVLTTSAFHFFLAFWFLYTAIFQFRLLPDPGWFPNTVGLSYAAIKTWLYYPLPGKILMALAMVFFFSSYPISIYRVVMNHKIAAPVCFIQLSAPSITMYAMTIMAQPSRLREQQLEASPALMTHFQELHRDLYLPVQHFMMILSLVGMVSVLHSLWARWPKFRLKEFSPAHVAFVFPLLSHTNAVQAYRSGVDSFSDIPDDSSFKIALYIYWCLLLVVGTIVNLVFTVKYVRRLPQWTKVDIAHEEEPVSASETMVHEMLLESGVHETMSKQLVSPALLQANETGGLVRVRRGSEDWRIHGPFVRTRNVRALGFDLIMSESELRQERDELLDWVAKNAPRKRSRTLSIPMMMKLKGKDGKDMYGTFIDDTASTLGHKRANTLVS